jgi:hypothetical protein
MKLYPRQCAVHSQRYKNGKKTKKKKLKASANNSIEKKLNIDE